MELREGDNAPNFNLPTDSGKNLSLSEFLEKKERSNLFLS